MTEEDLLSDDPRRTPLDRMFRFVVSPHDRKQRLAIMAVVRLLAARAPDPRVGRLLSAHEDLADHRDRARLARDLAGQDAFGFDLDLADRDVRWAVVRGVRGFGNGGDCRVGELPLVLGTEAAARALARDIFGNPFRPVSFSPSWRTIAAVALARMMYETRDFAAMPVMADALQDAGCEQEDVLGHCRGPGPHARGCWVVDGILGLS
jgi:hypothetical protein